MKKKLLYKSAILRLFYESKESWIGWFTLIVLSFLSGWFTTQIAELTGELIDLGVNVQYAPMWGVSVTLVVFLLCNCVRSGLNYYVNSKATEKMFQKVRRRIYAVLTGEKLERIEGKLQTGEVVSRLNGDVDRLCDIVSGTLAWYLRVIFEALVTLYACLKISVELSVVYLILMPISFYIMNRLSKTLRENQKKISIHSSNAASVVSETLDNMATVKVYHIEKQMRDKFAGEVTASWVQEMQMQKLESYIAGVRYVTQMLQMIGLFAASIYCVSRGMVTPGSAIAFVTICTNIRMFLELSDGMISNYHKAEGLAERIYEVLDLSAEVQKPENNLLGETHKKHQRNVVSSDKMVSRMTNTPCIAFENAFFFYDSGRQIFNDMTLHIGKGQRVGIVGPSGCGKSTLIKLICKFYTLSGGQLLWNGQDIDALSEEDVYQRVALVAQEPYLFEGSFYDNVANGKKDATEAEVIEALKCVQLWDHIVSLPDGIHTSVGEGGKFISGGQAQRVSIARALLKDAEVILLDEPTSALDAETEHGLIGALEALLKGKTSLIVTHRYAIIEEADYIYCLDENGTLVESGTPEELHRLGGYYDAMYCSQNGEAGEKHE